MADLHQDVITRYENLLREHDEYVEVHQTEREYVKGTLEREQLLNSSVQRMQNIMVTSRSSLLNHIHPDACKC
jgi:phosphopantetheine adenylyltransferase